MRSRKVAINDTNLSDTEEIRSKSINKDQIVPDSENTVVIEKIDGRHNNKGFKKGAYKQPDIPVSVHARKRKAKRLEMQEKKKTQVNHVKARHVGDSVPKDLKKTLPKQFKFHRQFAPIELEKLTSQDKSDLVTTQVDFYLAQGLDSPVDIAKIINVTPAVVKASIAKVQRRWRTIGSQAASDKATLGKLISKYELVSKDSYSIYADETNSMTIRMAGLKMFNEATTDIAAITGLKQGMNITVNNNSLTQNNVSTAGGSPVLNHIQKHQDLKEVSSTFVDLLEKKKAERLEIEKENSINNRKPILIEQ